MRAGLTPVLAAALLVAAGPLAAQDDDAAAMQSMTRNVLNGLGKSLPAPAATAGAGDEADDDLSRLVQQALSEGQSDAYVAALVDEAVDRGDVEVPEALRATDGTVDTKTLIASLVSRSTGTEATTGAPDVDTLRAEAADTGTSSAPVAEPEVVAAAAPELASEQAPAQAIRWHTVAAGESLAAISLAYYGNMQDHERIFRANRNLIDRPSLIYAGQVLRIP